MYFYFVITQLIIPCIRLYFDAIPEVILEELFLLFLPCFLLVSTVNV